MICADGATKEGEETARFLQLCSTFKLTWLMYEVFDVQHLYRQRTGT